MSRSDLPDAIECFLKWLEIRAANSGAPLTASRLRADAHHSALLRRLLDGKEPLPAPPPRSFSQPWYALVERGVGAPLEARRWGAGEVVINQHSWQLVRELGLEDWEVTYGDGSTLWRCRHTGSATPWGKKWLLERIK